MAHVITILLLLITSNVWASTVYKVIQEDGSVVYTDTPQNGAQEVTFGHTQSVITQPLATPRPPVRNKVTRQPAMPSFELTMLRPLQQQTIRDNLGRIGVVAQLTPQGEGTFELLLDGRVVMTSKQPVFELEQVDRGEHLLQMQFKHISGKILASTEQTVVYLHKASRLINPN